jgi:hypothetical protein
MQPPAEHNPESPAPASPGQGWRVEANDPQTFRHAIDFAVNYRGDVTLVPRIGQPIEGYVFDVSSSEGTRVIRVLPADGSPRRTIPIADLVRIEFTGRDTATGRSFDTWMKKYVERKLAGKDASIPSDPIEHG